MQLIDSFLELNYNAKLQKTREICSELVGVSAFYQEMNFFLVDNDEVQESILDYIYTTTLKLSKSLQNEKVEAITQHNKLSNDLASSGASNIGLIDDMLHAL